MELLFNFKLREVRSLREFNSLEIDLTPKSSRELSVILIPIISRHLRGFNFKESVV